MFRNRTEALDYLFSHFFPPRDWPRGIWALIKKPRHLSNKQRFILVVFWLNNGLHPDVIVEIFHAFGGYDQSAFRQVNWIIRQYPTSKWTSWNIALRRST